MFRLRHESIDDALLGELCGLFLHIVHALLAHHMHGRLGQITHDGLDIAAHVADLSELRRLDLHERRLDELREAAGNLRLADTGRADHEDVLRNDVLLHRIRQLTTAPAVAQRDGHGFLGLVLTHDIFIELRHDLPRRLLVDPECCLFHQSSSSTMILWLV